MKGTEQTYFAVPEEISHNKTTSCHPPTSDQGFPFIRILCLRKLGKSSLKTHTSRPLIRKNGRTDSLWNFSFQSAHHTVQKHTLSPTYETLLFLDSFSDFLSLRWARSSNSIFSHYFLPLSYNGHENSSVFVFNHLNFWKI